MATKKQLPAGKSKAVTAAAKRKAAASKKAPAKKATTKKVATPTAALPASPVAAQAPVSSPTGSLISPETWAQDQARLQSAAEDQDTADSLNEAESNADATYTQRTTDAAKAAAQRKLELQKQKDTFEKEKSTDYKNLDNTLAYRGAVRSSAAERGTKEVVNQHTNIANEYKNAEASVDTEVSDINTKAYNEREAAKTYVNKRRGTLAQRAAARGVYSEGAGPEDSGVTAPGMNPAASPIAKVAKSKAKTTTSKKKKAAANTAAAKRRIATKKKGK